MMVEMMVSEATMVMMMESAVRTAMMTTMEERPAVVMAPRRMRMILSRKG